MDEYLKLVQMDLETEPLLLEDTKRVKGLTSFNLTARLRNATLRDDQTSSRPMVHRVSGAAFHSQTLTERA